MAIFHTLNCRTSDHLGSPLRPPKQDMQRKPRSGSGNVSGMLLGGFLWVSLEDCGGFSRWPTVIGDWIFI